MSEQATNALVKWLRNSPSHRWTSTKLNRAATTIEQQAAEIERLQIIANAAAELIDAPDDPDAWKRLNTLVKGFATPSQETVDV